MGSFVNKLSPMYFSVGTPWGEITDAIDYTRGYAEQMRSTLETTIDNLETVISRYTPNFGGIDDDIPEIEHAAFPEAPDLTIDLNDNWPDTEIPVPSTNDPNVDLSYTEPLPPDDISDSFDHTVGSYSACLLDDLCQQVHDSLVNGDSTGLTDAIYNAIIDRNREARRLAEDRARRKLNAALGESGFDIPSGIATAAILELEEDILHQDMDAVNNTTIKDYDLAIQNARAVQELSLKLEEFKRKMFDTDEDRLLEVAKAAKDYVLAVYKENIKVYLAKWEGVKAKLSAAKAQIDAIVADNEAKIKVFLGRADVLKAQIDAIARENSAKADVVKAEAQVYESEVRAFESKYRAFIEEARVAIEKYRADVAKVMERERINVEAYKSESSLRERATEAVGNIASQGVASALGAIHMSMSYGYQGATSVRQSQNIGNSLSESHSYQEE